LTGLVLGIYIPPMDEELTALEDKVRQVAEVCQQLRAENKQLRIRLAEVEEDRRRLAEKVDGARTRLEALMQQIPE